MNDMWHDQARPGLFLDTPPTDKERVLIRRAYDAGWRARQNEEIEALRSLGIPAYHLEGPK